MTTKANNLGSGLTHEIVSERLKLADAQKKTQAKFDSIKAAADMKAAPVAQRKTLAFVPKMPGISKTKSKEYSGSRKIILKLDIKSPALKRRLGLKA